MSKTLAIKGNEKRGNEVIALLEMLGGNNSYFKLDGKLDDFYYYLWGDGGIYHAAMLTESIIIFTLDEFYKKYPYKVGDKIHSPCKGCIKTITGMKWNPNMETITYELDNKIYTNVDILNVHNHSKPDMETNTLKIEGSIMKNNTHSIIYLGNCVDDEIELQLGDYEIEVRDGKTYAVKKKPVFPTSYDECCKILGCKSNHFFTDFSYNGLDIEISNYEDKIDELLQNFRKLRYCRDAYWKIAGEEMGLDKPWEPDWQKTEERKFCIIRKNDNVITKWETKTIVKFLAFPTEEMRDALYENFKDLIEQCKELL